MTVLTITENIFEASKMYYGLIKSKSMNLMTFCSDSQETLINTAPAQIQPQVDQIWIEPHLKTKNGKENPGAAFKPIRYVILAQSNPISIALMLKGVAN